MRSKYYTMCTIVQNGDYSKFISNLKDVLEDIQSRGLYAEVQYNNPTVNIYSALVMSYRME